jgi:hypothetical protein
MRPLDFLCNVEARVQNELIQMPNVIREARLAVAALLGGPELVFEERIVQGADNGKVVAHRGGEAFRIGGRVVARCL